MIDRVAPGISPMIAIARKSKIALHQQIYDAFRVGIVDGRLRAGQRVPSTRTLAIELGVSRFPVLNAYSQLLAEGYFEAHVGAGTMICRTLPDRFAVSPNIETRLLHSSGGSRMIARRSQILPPAKPSPWLAPWGAFGVGQVAFDQFPRQVWASLVARSSQNMSAMALHYGDHMGSLALRETIASYLRTARSVRCGADQVMIVNGSQQALEISARVLLDPGSLVWVEEPGYRLAREVFLLAGCHLVPVPVDKEGLNVAAAIQRCPQAQAAVVTPSHQFPLGATLSAKRRLELLDWAQSTGAWIIEDDYDSEYRYDSSPIASLQGLDVNSRVIYIGTFSKVLFPSLRIGYLVIPADLVARFYTVRHAMDLGPSHFHQDVLTSFINEGHFARHIRKMRVLYRERRTALVESLVKEIGSEVEVLGGEAGMHLALTLPRGSRDVQIAEQAARQRLWAWPLSAAYMSDASIPGFILGFGSTTVSEIPGAVRKLKQLIETK